MSEKIIRSIATRYNASTDVIEKCIKQVVQKTGLTQNEVLSTLSSSFEESYISFEGKTYPRYFADADEINYNPDEYIRKLTTLQLQEILKLASYLYYNYEGGGLTDNSYDALEYAYNKKMKTKGRAYEKIGAPPVDKIRTKLPYKMPSLNKVKPGESSLINFISDANLVVSLKLDGVSGMVVYENGVIKYIYTRGDGDIGGDVTYLKTYIKFPSPIDRKDKFVVRGEFILPKSKWSTYAKQYANARSMVSAKINSGFVSPGLEDINYVAYSIIYPEGYMPERALIELKELGFEIPDYVTLDNPSVFSLMSLYQEIRLESEYDIDGLVLSLANSPFTQVGLGNPTDKVAFKMKLENQVRDSKILTVEWNISRYGRLVPVAVYESVYIEGVRLHRATLFNAAKVRDKKVNRGTLIKVIRSGDVIPTIIEFNSPGDIKGSIPPTTLPYGSWHWKGQDIYLDDPDGNRMVQIKRMEYFFSTIQVPGLKEGNLSNLWDAGYVTVKDITNISSPSEFIKRGSVKVKGIGPGKSKTFYNDIHAKMVSTRIDRFLEASGMTQGIGRKLIHLVLTSYPNILDASTDQIRARLKAAPVPGIGKVRADTLAENIPKIKKFLYSLGENDIKKAVLTERTKAEKLKREGYNPLIQGKTFVLTGFYNRPNYDLEDYIVDHQGSVVSAVSKDTAAVISANIIDVTNSALQAQSLGVLVVSVEEFIKRFKVKDNISTEEENGELVY